MMQQRKFFGWIMLLLFTVMLAAWTLGATTTDLRGRAVDSRNTATNYVAVAPLNASDTPPENTNSVRFIPLNIYFNTGTHPLAAYQFELKTLAGDVAIVGVEGGDPLPFQPAPYYDPAALQHSRVIIGAFSTDPHVPAGKNRIARIHVMITGPVTPQYQIIVQAAATTDGSPIQATATIEEGTKP